MSPLLCQFPLLYQFSLPCSQQLPSGAAWQLWQLLRLILMVKRVNWMHHFSAFLKCISNKLWNPPQAGMWNSFCDWNQIPEEFVQHSRSSILRFRTFYSLRQVRCPTIPAFRPHNLFLFLHSVRKSKSAKCRCIVSSNVCITHALLWLREGSGHFVLCQGIAFIIQVCCFLNWCVVFFVVIAQDLCDGCLFWIQFHLKKVVLRNYCHGNCCHTETPFNLCQSLMLVSKLAIVSNEYCESCEDESYVIIHMYAAPP